MALSDQEFDSLGFKFVWRIENFSYCVEKRGSSIKSPEFTPNLYYSNEVWKMQIFTRGQGCSNDTSFQLESNCKANRFKALKIDFQLYIFTSDGSLTSYAEKEKITIADVTRGTLIKHEELFGEKKEFYLPQDTLTLYLRMWESENVRSWFGQAFARTRIGVQKRTNTLEFSNFSFMKPSESRNFTIEPMMKEKISLKLYLTESTDSNERLQLDIYEDNTSQTNLVYFKIALLDAIGNHYHSTACDHWFDKREVRTTWAFPMSILRSNLLINKDSYLPDDTLILQCDCILSVGVIYSEIEIADVPSDKNCPYVNSLIPEVYNVRHKTENDYCLPKSLSSDLLNLYNEKKDSDFVLKSGSSEFPVHKLILVARSPVFCNMLSSDMIEKNANMVDIPDVDGDTVKRMLHFLYTDVVQVAEWDAVAKLYFAADKYAIESLKKKCSSFLERNVCASNVCEALELGDLHQGQDLKVAAMTFVLENGHEILNSEEWTQFKQRNGSLAADVLQWMFLKKTEKK